jgi:hypothetical protein
MPTISPWWVGPWVTRPIDLTMYSAGPMRNAPADQFKLVGLHSEGRGDREHVPALIGVGIERLQVDHIVSSHVHLAFCSRSAVSGNSDLNRLSPCQETSAIDFGAASLPQCTP